MLKKIRGAAPPPSTPMKKIRRAPPGLVLPLPPPPPPPIQALQFSFRRWCRQQPAFVHADDAVQQQVWEWLARQWGQELRLDANRFFFSRELELESRLTRHVLHGRRVSIRDVDAWLVGHHTPNASVCSATGIRPLPSSMSLDAWMPRAHYLRPDGIAQKRYLSTDVLPRLDAWLRTHWIQHAVEFEDILHSTPEKPVFVPVTRSIWNIHRWSYKGLPSDDNRMEHVVCVDGVPDKVNTFSSAVAAPRTLERKSEELSSTSSVLPHVLQGKWSLTQKQGSIGPSMMGNQSQRIHILGQVPELSSQANDYTIVMKRERSSNNSDFRHMFDYAKRQWKLDVVACHARLDAIRKKYKGVSASPEADTQQARETRSTTNIHLRRLVPRIQYTVGVWLVQLSLVEQTWDVPPQEWALYPNGEIPPAIWDTLCDGQHVELEVELNMQRLYEQKGDQVDYVLTGEVKLQQLAREKLVLLNFLNSLTEE